jgi:exodeoxyribonuclease VII small subunit
MAKKKETLSYDAAFKELQTIMAHLQSDETSIDMLIAYVSRSNELINICKERLRSVESELQSQIEDN